MKKQFNGLTMAIVVFAGMLATPAHATLQVQVGGTNNAGSINGGTICVDNAACDSNSAVGIVTISNVVAGVNFTVQGSTATSFSPNGALSLTLNGSPTGPASFTIAASDTNFSNPTPPLEIVQTVGGTSAANGPSANFTAVGFFSATNTAFVTTGTSTGTAAANINGGTGTAGSPLITSGNPYSLTEFITVNITALGTGINQNIQVNADLTSTAVPEPAGVALLGGALLLTAGSLRRRFRRV